MQGEGWALHALRANQGTPGHGGKALGSASGFNASNSILFWVINPFPLIYVYMRERESGLYIYIYIYYKCIGSIYELGSRIGGI